MKEHIKEIRFIVCATRDGLRGSWGRGETLSEAAYSAHKNGAKKTDTCGAYVVFNDPDAHVDGFGYVCWGGKEAPNAHGVCIGPVGKLGGIMEKKNK